MFICEYTHMYVLRFPRKPEVSESLGTRVTVVSCLIWVLGVELGHLII